jgi:tetratricopeptide (TPR) repeat protein
MTKVIKAADKHYKEAWKLYLNNHYEQAKQQLDAAIELAPDWEQPHLLLGQIYYLDEEGKDVGAAIPQFRQVTELEPEWDEGYGWLSSVLSETDSLDEAVAMRRKAVQFAPRDPRHHVSLGVMLTQQRKFEEAIQSLRQGIKLKPDYCYADACLFLAEALVANNQIEEACKQWRSILFRGEHLSDEWADVHSISFVNLWAGCR